MKNIRKTLSGNRGAASVLVVFMLIALVTLGAMALTTAAANQRLGDKATVWSRRFYRLDNAASENLAEVDAALYHAETGAREYIARESYRAPGWPGLSDEAQQIIRGQLSEVTPEKLEALFIRLYRAFAVSALKDLPQEGGYILTYDHETISDEIFLGIESQNDKPLPLILVDYTVTTDENDVQHNLHALLDVRCPKYSFSVGSEGVSGLRVSLSQRRYGILRWQQWQPEHDYSQSGIMFDSRLVGAPDDFEWPEPDQDAPADFPEDEAPVIVIVDSGL